METGVTHLGNTSFTMDYVLTNGEGTVVAEGEAVLVMYDYPGRPPRCRARPRCAKPCKARSPTSAGRMRHLFPLLLLAFSCDAPNEATPDLKAAPDTTGQNHTSTLGTEHLLARLQGH